MRNSKAASFFTQHKALLKSMVSRAEACRADVRELKLGVRNSGDSESIQIQIHDTIGDEWAETDSASLTKRIRDSKGQPLFVDINSLGGSAYDGIAIYTALAAHDAEVNIMISGAAYSAASVIAMAGDHITIGEGANFGIHPAWLFTMGNQHELRDKVKWLETLDKGLVDIYAHQTGQSREQIEAWFTGENNDGTWFSAEEAVKHGFANEMFRKKSRKKSESSASAASGPPQSVADRLAEVLRRQKESASRDRQQLLAKIRSDVESRPS